MARIRLATIATTETPPVGQLAIYAKTNLKLYYKDENGIEYELLTGSTPGIGGYNVDYYTLTPTDIAAKSIDLSGVPTQNTKVLLDIADGGGSRAYGLDYYVYGSTLTWESTRLDGLLEEGDELRVVWF